MQLQNKGSKMNIFNANINTLEKLQAFLKNEISTMKKEKNDSYYQGVLYAYELINLLIESANKGIKE